LILFGAPIPRYRSLQGRLEFNELSRLSPVFVSAAFEAAVLPPKFIGAGPNALRQRMHIHMKPHCLMNGFSHISSTGSIAQLTSGTSAPAFPIKQQRASSLKRLRSTSSPAHGYDLASIPAE
jgi:hypothetical protein